MASITGYEQGSSLLCLGCGEDVMDRSDNRRALQGADEVVRGWRAMLEVLQCEVEEERLCAESMIYEDVSKEKMCRSCFSGFSRYLKLQSSLQENLLQAVRSQAQSQAHVSRKRPRLAKSASYSCQPSLADSVGESSQSPTVSVR